MDFIIRCAVPADQDALFVLIRDHAQFEGAKVMLTPDRLGAVLQNPEPSAEIFVAVGQRDLLGYAALTYDYSLWRTHRWAHLDCLFVREVSRGRSVGRELLGAVIQAAREQGADRLEWQTPTWNERAIAFYYRQNAEGQQKMRFCIEL